MNNNNLSEAEKTKISADELNKTIDENKASETNNRIHYKKMGLFTKFLITIVVLMGLFFISFYAVKYAKKFVDDGEVTTTTVTTKGIIDERINYLKSNGIRKYVNDNRIILLLPYKLSNLYIDIIYVKGDKSQINVSTGTYNILSDNSLELSNENGSKKYKLNEDGIEYSDNKLKQSDNEYKYYKNDKDFLIINATPDALVGVYIHDNNIIWGNYMEYDDKITISTNNNNKLNFIKSDNSINIEGNILTLAK